MQPKIEYPLNTWRLNHQNLRGTVVWLRVQKLDRAFGDNAEAISIEEAWEAWLADRTLPTPDLVRCMALYGHSCFLTRDWKEFPIEVPSGQEDAWREWGLGASLFEFSEQWQGGVAGGFLELAAKEPALTGEILSKQYRTMLDRLIELTNKPVEWYTPESFTEDELAEDEDSADRARIAEPFGLYEDLLAFRWTLQKYRMFSITGEDAELGLPSPALYEALMKIDVNLLIGTMEEVEPKLRPILRHLDKHRYSVAIEATPEWYWWRHWKSAAKQRPRKK